MSKRRCTCGASAVCLVERTNYARWRCPICGRRWTTCLKLTKDRRVCGAELGEGLEPPWHCAECLQIIYIPERA